MIRAMQKADIDRVSDIWLDANRKAHHFIPAQYWQSNYDAVKEMLPQAEVYVFEQEQKIYGFIGLNEEYIEGIFIKTNHNVTILDGAKVTFGDNVFIAPNCVFSTAGHAIDSEQRNSGLEIALPITEADKKKYPIFEETSNN